jgi:hypothetical protein
LEDPLRSKSEIEIKIKIEHPMNLILLHYEGNSGCIRRTASSPSTSFTWTRIDSPELVGTFFPT